MDFHHKKRYAILRLIAKIYKAIGLISAVLTLLSVIGFCAASLMGGVTLDSVGQELGGSASGMGILSGGGAAISFYAMGEGILLLIALEENTRITAILLERQQRSE